MAKIMIADNEMCTGCRLCEMVCSVKKERASDPSKARIHVNKWEMGGSYFPLVCQHCDEPLCATVCPVNAIRRDDSIGRVIVDDDLCVGCQACISICPLGSLRYSSEQNRVLRCDLCGGDPACVKVCSTCAIQYLDSERIQERKKYFAAKGLRVALKRN